MRFEKENVNDEIVIEVIETYDILYYKKNNC